MNSRQIFFALLIVLMATIVTASPLNLDQLIERKNAQKDESPSKEKNGEVKATLSRPGRDTSGNYERDLAAPSVSYATFYLKSVVKVELNQVGLKILYQEAKILELHNGIIKDKLYGCEQLLASVDQRVYGVNQHLPNFLMSFIRHQPHLCYRNPGE
ncbi:hypothetical protein GLOIN_2v1531131 [Rhizophagus irregularis DAOM 181602=DAOM 197198]|nr:hypothetical protein GLOIN_2v1531131 [Rhizophagus irregularis DAOM 181602=DAOM 197198]